MKKRNRIDRQEIGFAIEQNYPIKQILKLRDSLTEVMRGEFEGRAVFGPQFDRLVKIVHEQLPGDVDYETVYESCRHLAGTFLNATDIRAFAHRMAGNQHRLRRHRAVTPWVVQRYKEWVPLQILSVKREFREKSGPGGNFHFFALAGSVAGLSIRRWWSLRYCRYVASDFSFSKRVSGKARQPAKYPFTAMEQFVTLRCYGLIEPALCKTNEPMFSVIEVAPSLADWNREQLKFRFRVDGPKYDCKAGFARDFQCQNCVKGYAEGDAGCRAGTHARNYVIKRCEHCGDDEALFDPDWVADVCVHCQRLANSRRPK